MSREKQIEEVARDICECFNNDGTCYQDDKVCDCKCDSFTDAQYLYEKGYRKQSAVIDEFAERLKQEMENLARMVYSDTTVYLVGKSLIDGIAEEMKGGAENEKTD